MVILISALESESFICGLAFENGLASLDVLTRM